MKRCCRNQATQLIFLVIFIPAMLLPIALPMAGALAGYENWTFDEAFEFVICGLLRMFHLFLQAILLDYIVNLIWYKHQIGTAYVTTTPAVAEKTAEIITEDDAFFTTFSTGLGFINSIHILSLLCRFEFLFLMFHELF